jgi:hypothetical protein
MRFPIYTVGLCALASVATLAAWRLALACPFVAADFRCTGWLRDMIGVLSWWPLMAMLILPLLFVMLAWRLAKWARRADDRKEIMRFPVYAVGFFALCLLLNVVVGWVAEHHCSGSFGSYRCQGWATPFAELVLLWEMFYFVLLPVVGFAVLVRVGYWFFQWRKKAAC